MTTPRLVIDVDKIEHNTRTIVALCDQHGIEVTGVTKVTCGHPEVARAMLRGGVSSIADSRLENIQRLIEAGVDTEFMLLRLPALSRVDEVVDSVAVSMNSELAVLEALDSVSVDAILCTGDIVGYGACPRECGDLAIPSSGCGKRGLRGWTRGSVDPLRANMTLSN